MTIKTVNEALTTTDEISDEDILSLDYGIKYFSGYLPPEQRARLSDMRKRLEKLEAERRAEKKARQGADVVRETTTRCDCGHTDLFPMMTARGTACANCFDRMSD